MKYAPVLRSFLPLLFAVLTAFGVLLSEEVKVAVTDNIEAFIVAFAALSELVPSIKEAFAKAKA